VPPPIISLRGVRFGRLLIPADAEPEIRNRHAYWPCVCDCGARIVARGSKLRAGRIVSCGCWRADPAVRRAARMRLPAHRRRALARIRHRDHPPD
jgi:hypothetical protein